MTKRALLIVDVQLDFQEGGPLGCPGGKAVEDEIIRLIDSHEYNLIVTSADAHPEETEHFNKWPVHCVAGTPGAEAVLRRESDYHVEKGQSTKDDGYSAFEGRTEEGWYLYKLLVDNGITDVDVVGIAWNYCELATALDAAKRGFNVRALRDASAAVPDEVADVSYEQATQQLLDAGVEVV